MKNLYDLDNINIEKLVSDRLAFNDFVFTPITDAVIELEKRWKDKKLSKKIDGYLQEKLPKQFVKGFKAVLFRQLFTPNYEIRHFMDIADVIGLEPVLMEYHDDKFTSNNPLKHALGKMRFRRGVGRKGGVMVETRNVIDFIESDGSVIKEVKTVWGQPLIDFHHELLKSVYPKSVKYLYDASRWLCKHGGGATGYYKGVLSFFVRNAILFENYVLYGHELLFVKEIFLPSFIDVWRHTGEKPIIVRLLSLDTQDDVFWLSHPLETMGSVDNKRVV